MRPRARSASATASTSSRADVAARRAPMRSSPAGAAAASCATRALASSRSVSDTSHLFSTTASRSPCASPGPRCAGPRWSRPRSRRTRPARRRRARPRARSAAARSSRPCRRPSARLRRPAVSTSTIVRPSTSSARVDRVARRAGLLVHDHPLLAEEGVHERRLADVRPADHGQANRVLGEVLRARARCAAAISASRSSRSPVPTPCAAETGAARRGRACGTPPPAARRRRCRSCWPRRPTGTLDTSQQVRQLRVAGAHAGARVDHEQHRRRVGEREPRLLLHLPRAGPAASSRSTPPVSTSRKVDAVPLGRHLLAVARHSRLGMGDRLARAAQPVDERRLADVRDSRRRRPWRFEPLASSAHASAGAADSLHELHDPVDDLFDRQAGGVDLDRVVGRAQRRRRAGRVEPVALLDRAPAPRPACACMPRRSSSAGAAAAPAPPDRRSGTP